MSAMNKDINKKTPVFDKEKFDSLNKKFYGLNNKDLEEIYVFINDFDAAVKEVDGQEGDVDVKHLIDTGNKIPSHCGYIVCDYFVLNNGIEMFNKTLLMLYDKYKVLFEQDQESTKTTDVYEVLACLIQFAPPKALRKFITDNFEMSKEIYKDMRKRPGTNATMSARYSELFITSKFDDKYSNLIYENYSAMLDFLKQKNGEIEGVDDAVKINFNQIRDLMKDFYERNKKESLKKVNKLVNKKADVGEAFFYWIALNPSCAMEVIMKNDNITGDFIEQFLCQMRIQYIVELVALLENLSEEKMTFMDYVNKTYKLEDVDSCYSRLANIVKKDSLEVYGTLLRQISFYPSLMPTDNEKAFCSVLSQLQTKLSSVANNLTAGISEKSMSITIVPLGRSRVYQNIMDKIEGVDGNSSSFAAKLRDKDIIKKIRESELSWRTLDQHTGATMISVLEILQDIYRAKPAIVRNVAIKEAYKELVLRYGIIMTLPYFTFVVDSLQEKIIYDATHTDSNEDYEDMK